MVGGGVVLVLIVSSAPSVEARGEGPSISELRSRVRPSFAFAPAVSLVSWLGEPAFAVGGAIEPGLIFGDRFALSLHFEALVIPPPLNQTNVRSILLIGGPTLDWFPSDRWSVGAGVLGVFNGGVVGYGLMLPLRASWRLMPRGENAQARSSVMIGLQAGPGLQFSDVFSNSVTVIGGGLLTVGFGWW